MKYKCKHYREKRNEQLRKSYRKRMQDPKYREKDNERKRKWRRIKMQDPKYREKEKERNRKQRRIRMQDPTYRTKRWQKIREIKHQIKLLKTLYVREEISKALQKLRVAI
ncbi:MAG: hypothetical protein ABII09_03500 [Planctomycetota bacterium]